MYLSTHHVTLFGAHPFCIRRTRVLKNQTCRQLQRKVKPKNSKHSSLPNPGPIRRNKGLGAPPCCIDPPFFDAAPTYLPPLHSRMTWRASRGYYPPSLVDFTTPSCETKRQTVSWTLHQFFHALASKPPNGNPWASGIAEGWKTR